MMSEQLVIENATMVNEGKIFPHSSVLINNGRIEKISTSGGLKGSNRLNAQEKYLIPGVIDDQVHFRDPGAPHKADISSESRAAVAGGITTFFDMPNTKPNTLTQELLEDKYQLGANKSLANFSFYMGASNDNIDELLKTNKENICGIKVFMGASTGNMLVDNEKTLNRIFAECDNLIATHCEDEKTIRLNSETFRQKYGDHVPIEKHPEIRSAEACFLSSNFAISLAKKHNSRLHVLHLTTGREMSLFENNIPLEKKRITAEVCVHHLWFSDQDYAEKGTFIKWNPAVKTSADRQQLREALLDNRIDVVATDHAPHTKEEKQNSYFNAPSGGPLVQHALVAMLELYHQKVISLEQLVEKMCHAPAICFGVQERGFIREGYFADLTLVDLKQPWQVQDDNILYKCGWSPFTGFTFQSRVTHTWVNGNLAYENGVINDSVRGQRVRFKP